MTKNTTYVSEMRFKKSNRKITCLLIDKPNPSFQTKRPTSINTTSVDLRR